MAWTGYTLEDTAKAKLLARFPPKFPDVIAHHVTYCFGRVQPVPAAVIVEGYKSDESLEAVVVSVNGETKRPDGGTYHITLSLDRQKGRKPVHSNKVLEEGWEPVEPFGLITTPTVEAECIAAT